VKKQIQLSIILILTILITRITTLYLIDPDIIFKGFELHHIYYGILLLTLTLIFLRKKKQFAPLIIISIGLIIDELEYTIRGFGNSATYAATLPSVIILTAIIIPIIIYERHKNKKTN